MLQFIWIVLSIIMGWFDAVAVALHFCLVLGVKILQGIQLFINGLLERYQWGTFMGRFKVNAIRLYSSCPSCFSVFNPPPKNKTLCLSNRIFRSLCDDYILSIKVLTHCNRINLEISRGYIFVCLSFNRIDYYYYYFKCSMVFFISLSFSLP